MRYSVLNLTGTYAETAPFTRTLLNAGRARLFRFDAFLSRIEHLLATKKIDTVLVDHRLDFRFGLPGSVEAIRHQLDRLRSAGKRVIYYARSYETVHLYLASACSERIIHPLGTVRHQGMARSFLFFKRLLERYDVETHVVRRGRFKSAGDPFRVESLDEYNREQHRALLQETMTHFNERIQQGLGRSGEEIEALLAGKVLAASEAVESRWVTRSVTKAALLEEWRREKARAASLKKVRVGFGKGRRVGVLVLEGAIVDGISRQDPAMGQAVGSDSFIEEIEALTKSKAIKGVVLRVNSGGGAVIASEEIAEGLAKLAEKKPLVVSMGGVAGSGGYWVALPGERIFSEKNTITGSVGVILMLFSAREGLNRLGVTEDTIKIGEFADLGSPFKKLTEQERMLLEEEVERLYQDFLRRVADSRKQSVESVDHIAEGRIWTGDRAKGLGLVDEVGGLDAALSFLRERIKAKRIRVEFHPVVHYSFVQRLIMRNAAEVSEPTLPWFALRALAPLQQTAFSRAGLLGSLAARPLAIVPDLGEYR